MRAMLLSAILACSTMSLLPPLAAAEHDCPHAEPLPLNTVDFDVTGGPGVGHWYRVHTPGVAAVTASGTNLNPVVLQTFTDNCNIIGNVVAPGSLILPGPGFWKLLIGSEATQSYAVVVTVGDG